MARKRRQKSIFQDSPFLEFPGEIRMMIYEAALIKPTPIDLWPHNFVETPENDASLAKRIAKGREAHPSVPEWRWLTPLENTYVPKFRRQDDLLYVRKQMATGLLGTCKQICREATSIFWCRNTFRFSGDLDWEGVRRFLVSIGPNAISRLHRLEVFVPLDYKSWIVEVDKQTQPWAEQDWEVYREGWAKNTPKMHMAKLGKRTRGVEENVEVVASLLAETKATLEISLVLPRGFVLQGGMSPSFVDPEIYVPEELQFKPPFMRVKFVVEPGARVYGMDLPKTVPSSGIDFICIPGSFWWQTADTTDEEAKVTELKRYESVYEDLELLDGLQELMQEGHDKLAVPGMGGRVNKSAGPGHRKVERVLKGFGGCRFTRRLGFDCDICGSMRFEPGNKSLKEDDYNGARCETCLNWVVAPARYTVTLKKKTRALRLAGNT